MDLHQKIDNRGWHHNRPLNLSTFNRNHFVRLNPAKGFKKSLTLTSTEDDNLASYVRI